MLALFFVELQTGDVKYSVIVVQIWFYGNVNEGWDESSVVHRIPTD